MGILSSNLKFLRKQHQLTQTELATVLGIKRPVIGAYEEDRAEPKLSLLIDMGRYFGVEVDDLISRDLASARQPKRTLFDRSKIPVVPVKAAAGYLNGYADVEYIDSLPTVDLTTTEIPLTSDMRVFQIAGDSMLPIPDSSYIICSKVENLALLKEGKRHIVVTMTEGIVYKRVYRFEDRLRLVSDNAVFSPFEVHLGDVTELWKTVGFILPDEE
ncbi:MAG: helix-turn-helix domain-containing protein [Flavobacteriales bacterium]|jgi:transcriptional regulator with XRE-family HTH domain